MENQSLPISKFQAAVDKLSKKTGEIQIGLCQRGKASNKVVAVERSKASNKVVAVESSS
eukprot:SAG31_NODE_2926_length_4901_cov_2.229696_4_plen_59_part_00